MKRLLLAVALFWTGMAIASPIQVKKNQAYEIKFAMLDETAPAAFLSSLTITDTCYYRDGGTWQTLAVTDETSPLGALGAYVIELSAGEMNHDQIVCVFRATGAVDNMVTIDTFDADVDDLVRSTTPANTLTVSASNLAAVNVQRIGGVEARVDDLIDFLVDGYDTTSDKLTGVVLVDTTTTNTDMITVSAIRQELDNNSNRLFAIETDTNSLQVEWLDGGRLDLILDKGNLETYHLDHLLAVAYNSAAPEGVSDSLLNELTENDGGETRFTANALEQGPAGGGGGPTAADIADAVWDELITDHAVEGSYGKHQYDETYPHGVTFYWDTAAANDAGNGLTAATAKRTWSAVLALATSGRGDTIVMVEGSSSDAEIVMNKDDLTLKCDHPQRCILTKTTGSTTTTLTMSADRMILEGIKLDATSSGTANNALLVTGEDCIVRNCLFANVDNTSITITGDRTRVDAVTLYEYSDSFVPKIDEVQTIAITGTPSDGTWTITCDNSGGLPTETDTIEWDGDNAAVQTVLDAAFAVDAIVAGGTFMSAQSLTFSGTGYTGIDKDMCTVDISLLVDATDESVVETIKGVPDVYDASPGIYIDGTSALEGVVISHSRFAGSGGSVTNAVAMDGTNLTQTRVYSNVFQDIAAAYAVVELSAGPSYTAVYNNVDALSKGYITIGSGSETVNSQPYAVAGADMNLTGSAIADLWDESTIVHTVTDTFGAYVNDLVTDMALERADTTLILADTSEIQGKLPSGDLSEFDPATTPVELRASAGSAGINAEELVDDIWDESTIGHAVGGSYGLWATDVLNDTAAIQPLAVTIDATVNHVSYGNAQLVRATTPANTLDTDVMGNVSADIIEISGDATAADALETMLDGTGGTVLTLKQIIISSTGNDSALVITGSGAGHGVLTTGGVTGNGIHTLGGGEGGHGAFFDHTYSSGLGLVIHAGMKIFGNEIARHGLEIVAIGGSGEDSLHIGKPAFGSSVHLEEDLRIDGAIFADITGDLSGSVNSVSTAVVTDDASRTASKADVSNLDVAVSTRSSHNAADVWDVSTRLLSSVVAIIDGVWNEGISGHATIDTFGDQLGTIVDAVLVDTDQIQSKLPSGTITDSAAVTAAMTSYDVAKQGEEMDLVDAPNATAIAAIQSGLSTFTIGGAVTLANNAITEASIADGAITTIKVATPDDFKADLSSVSTFDNTSDKVTLGNTAHGGSSATITLEHVVVSAVTANESAVVLTGNGTGDGLRAIGGTTGNGLRAVGGATSGHGMLLVGVATGDGLHSQGGSASGDGIDAVLGGSGVDVRGDITGGIVGDITGAVSGAVGSVAAAVETDAASRTASKADVSALATAANLATIDTAVDGIQIDLDNGTDGLGAIKDTADAIEVDTQNLQSQIGTAGAGLTDLGGMSTGMKAEVETEADDALVLNHLDHLLAEDYDPAAEPGAPTALFNELFADDGSGSPQYTANALELSPSGGASAAVIADAVWNESMTGHTDAGKAGQQLWTDIDATLVQVDAIKAETALIVSDTNELQTDDIPLVLSDLNDTTAAEVWALSTRTVTGGTIDTNNDMRGTDDASTHDAAAIWIEATRTVTGGTINLNTSEQGTDNAALATVCTEARLSELDGANLPTDVGAIPTTPMRGTNNAALASVCTEGRLAELDAANLPFDIDTIPTTPMRGTDNASTHGAIAVWAVGARTVTGGVIDTTTANTDMRGTDNAAVAGDAMNLTGLAHAQIKSGMATSAEIDALNDIDAAGVTTAVTTALNTYDSPTTNEMDAGFAGVSAHTAADVVTAIFDRVGDGLTYDSAIEAMQAVMFGKSTRLGNTVTFYKNDGVSPKVTATIGSGGTRSDVSVLP